MTTLPGFHAPKEPKHITIEKDKNGNCWHHYEPGNDKPIAIEPKAITGLFTGVYLKLSENKNVIDKEGLERLKIFVSLTAVVDDEEFTYVFGCGLNTTFSRTLVNGLDALSSQDLKRNWALEVDAGKDEEKGIIASLRDSKTKEIIFGVRYGKKWDGMDYPKILERQLIKLNADQKSMDLFYEYAKIERFGDKVRTPVSPKKIATKSTEVNYLFPQHNVLIRKVRDRLNIDVLWVSQYFQNRFKAMPGNLPQEAIEQTLIDWSGGFNMPRFKSRDQAIASFSAYLQENKNNGNNDLASTFITWYDASMNDAVDSEKEQTSEDNTTSE